MTPKDYVYLSLIALSAIVFYWTGFYGGFSSTLRILRKEEEGVGAPALGDLSLGMPSVTSPVMPSVQADVLGGLESAGGRQNKPAEAMTAKTAQQYHYQAQSVYFGRN